MVFKKENIEYRKKRTAIIIFTVLLLLAIYLFKDASYALRSISSIAFVVLFYVIGHFFDIRFKRRHYFYIILIAIFSFLLSPLYFLYPNYDKIQHIIQPMFTCSIIFYMISKLHLELKWKIVFTFFIVAAILGLFEIGEFILDSFFNYKLQGVFLRDIHGIEKFRLLMDPLKDTMIDMLFGVLGAGMYCITFAFVMRRKLRKIYSGLIEKDRFK